MAIKELPDDDCSSLERGTDTICHCIALRQRLLKIAPSIPFHVLDNVVPALSAFTLQQTQKELHPKTGIPPCGSSCFVIIHEEYYLVFAGSIGNDVCRTIPPLNCPEADQQEFKSGNLQGMTMEGLLRSVL